MATTSTSMRQRAGVFLVLFGMLATIAPLTFATPAWGEDESPGRPSCDKEQANGKSYEKFDDSSGSETLVYGDSSVDIATVDWGGSGGTADNEVEVTFLEAGAGYTVDICMKAGTADNTLTSVTQSGGDFSYSEYHDNDDISHVGFLVVPPTVVYTPEPPLELVPMCVDDDDYQWDVINDNDFDVDYRVVQADGDDAGDVLVSDLTAAANTRESRPFTTTWGSQTRLETQDSDGDWKQAGGSATKQPNREDCAPPNNNPDLTIVKLWFDEDGKERDAPEGVSYQVNVTLLGENEPFIGVGSATELASSKQLPLETDGYNVAEGSISGYSEAACEPLLPQAASLSSSGSDIDVRFGTSSFNDLDPEGFSPDANGAGNIVHVVCNQKDTPTVTRTLKASVALEKSVDANHDGNFDPEIETADVEGADVDFRVVITNTGEVSGTIMELTDAFGDDELSILEDCLDFDDFDDTLSPGESTTCEFTMEDYAPVDGETLTNVAAVTLQTSKGDRTADDDAAVMTDEEVEVKEEVIAPAADLDVECVDKHAIASGTLDNTASTVAVTFQVLVDGGHEGDEIVVEAGGEHELEDIDVTEAETVTVVNVDGDDVLAGEDVDDCSEPEPTEVRGEVIEKSDELPRTGISTVLLTLMGLLSMGLGSGLLRKRE